MTSTSGRDGLSDDLSLIETETFEIVDYAERGDSMAGLCSCSCSTACSCNGTATSTACG